MWIVKRSSSAAGEIAGAKALRLVWLVPPRSSSGTRVVAEEAREDQGPDHVGLVGRCEGFVFDSGVGVATGGFWGESRWSD